MSERFQIHLQGTADTQKWLQAEGQLRKLDSAADEFISSLRQGVGIDLGGKLVNSISKLPQLFDGFLQRGFEFNKTMATSEGGLANILAKFMKLDAQAAKQEAAKAMAKIVEWEPKAAGSLQDLVQGFMATVGAGQAAGVSVEQNVELVGKFANALAALGMDASQLTQEMRAIFTGNITPDAQLAKTLEITPQAIQKAKQAGQLYEYLNKQIGTLGATAAGPGVVLSSLNSVIDKTAGALSKGLFNELIEGAELLTEALSDPAITSGLEAAGVGIGKLVSQGVNLSLWAAQNAPLLLNVAEGAVRVGAALAGIKLATLIAGLVLKAQRWAMVTTAVTANTTALAANTTAAAANAAAAPAAAAAGKAGGVAMGKSWAAGFKGLLGGLMPAIVIGLTMKIMSQASEIMSQFADWQNQNRVNARNLQERKSAPEVLKDTIGQASTPTDVNAARRLGEIMLRDARRAGDEVLVNRVNAIMGKFDQLVGKQVDHKKAAEEAAAAQDAFNAALVEGKAAAGDSAAKIQLATDSVAALVKKLEEATKKKLDASTFEALIKSLDAIDKTQADEATVKNVGKLIAAAGELRDLKAAAAKEAEQQAAKAKSDADDLLKKQIEQLELQARVLESAGHAAAARDATARAKAMRLGADLAAQGLDPAAAAGVVKSESEKSRAEEVSKKQRALELAAIEDDIAAKRAAGDKAGAEAAQDRLKVLQLARQHEESLGLTRSQAEARARQRVADERAANEREQLSKDFTSGKRAGGRGGAAPLSAADRWGDLRKNSGLRSEGGSLKAFNELQKTPLRDTFHFPLLDAFAASQRPQGTETGPQQTQGGGADVAGAAKQAAQSAAQMAQASAAKDAAVFAELTQLRSKLDLVKAQAERLQSQLANSNRS